MNLEKFDEWVDKVSRSKRDLDKMMFDDLIKLVKTKLATQNPHEVSQWLEEMYRNNVNSRMVGPKLLANCSKMVRDKLWSLSR